MSCNFVRICCDLYFKTVNLPAWYRLYVNDELFVERSVDINKHQAIQETLAIKAEPGRYLIWTTGPNQTKAHLRHLSVLQGTAIVEDNRYIVIK